MFDVAGSGCCHGSSDRMPKTGGRQPKFPATPIFIITILIIILFTSIRLFVRPHAHGSRNSALACSIPTPTSIHHVV